MTALAGCGLQHPAKFTVIIMPPVLSFEVVDDVKSKELDAL